MEETIGQALTGFDKGFAAFRDELPAGSGLADMVFSNTSAWANLLVYKLVPHLAGEGCLVAAVAGGTNTGKSTVFNILLGQTVSPVVTTAAATRRPVLAANARRAAQCLEAKLVPEFLPRPIEAQAVVSDTTPVNTLFVAQIDALPDRLVLLDTPDVDSIDKENWEVAENTRAAGDALIAVLTAEKYKDERVVEFFRRAKDAGRIILPLMNKADPADAFLTARKQLDEFCADVGLDDVPRFVIPHDFAVTKGQQRPISSTDGSTDLKTYLESLDVPAIKQRVYRDTVAHFAREAGTFLDRCDELASSLRTVVNEFEARAAAFADKYDPAPGAEIGGLFHEFVQAKRGPVRRMIGSEVVIQ